MNQLIRTIGAAAIMVWTTSGVADDHATLAGGELPASPTGPPASIPIAPYSPPIADPQTAEAWRELAPAEAEMLLKIQRRMGGPMADSLIAPSRTEGPAGRQAPSRNPVWGGPRDPAAKPGAPMRHDRQVRALRDAARRIDESAAMLEDLELYHQADQARELANSLRGEARRLAGHQGESAQNPPVLVPVPLP